MKHENEQSRIAFAEGILVLIDEGNYNTDRPGGVLLEEMLDVIWLLNRRTRETQVERQALCELRRWLKAGATIRATDPTKPVLELLSDGSVLGGLTINFPPGQ